MKSEIKKWGHSAAMRIPRTIMEQCQLEINSTVSLKVQGAKLIIEADTVPDYSLKELLVTCTPAKMKRTAEDRDWLNDKPKGKELL